MSFHFGHISLLIWPCDAVFRSVRWVNLRDKSKNSGRPTSFKVMTKELDSPLAGVKVVEITSIYSGPMAGMMLAELGAQVTKVESPSGPDPVRSQGLAGTADGVNSTFYSLNRGKRFCSIDAKTSRGKELLFDLVVNADVFIHNMRPGKAEGLGLDYESLSLENPRIIYGAITGHGPEGGASGWGSG